MSTLMVCDWAGDGRCPQPVGCPHRTEHERNRECQTLCWLEADIYGPDAYEVDADAGPECVPVEDEGD